jgi:hypothetical protein
VAMRRGRGADRGSAITCPARDGAEDLASCSGFAAQVSTSYCRHDAGAQLRSDPVEATAPRPTYQRPDALAQTAGLSIHSTLTPQQPPDSHFATCQPCQELLARDKRAQKPMRAIR